MVVIEEFWVVMVNIGERLVLVVVVGDLVWFVGVFRNGLIFVDFFVWKLVVKVGCELVFVLDFFVENGS